MQNFIQMKILLDFLLAPVSYDSRVRRQLGAFRLRSRRIKYMKKKTSIYRRDEGATYYYYFLFRFLAL